MLPGGDVASLSLPIVRVTNLLSFREFPGRHDALLLIIPLLSNPLIVSSISVCWASVDSSSQKTLLSTSSLPSVPITLVQRLCYKWLIHGHQIVNTARRKYIWETICYWNIVHEFMFSCTNFIQVTLQPIFTYQSLTRASFHRRDCN